MYDRLWNVLNDLYDKIVFRRSLVEPIREGAAIIVQQEDRESFLEWCLLHLPTKKSLEEEIDILAKRKFDAKRSVQTIKNPSTRRNMRREVNRLSAKITELKELQASVSPQEPHVTLHDDLCNIPRVDRVYAKNGELYIETQCLYSRFREGWRKVGFLTITFRTCSDFPPWDVSWVNKDFKELKRHAPQVYFIHGAVSCKGTLDEPLREALLKNDWVRAVSMVVRFAECPAPPSEGAMSMFRRVRLSRVPEWYLKDCQ